MMDWFEAGVVTFISVVAATGVSYGATRAKVERLKEDLGHLREVPERLARIETSLDWLVNKHRGAGNPPPPNEG